MELTDYVIRNSFSAEKPQMTAASLVKPENFA
jgi:hypothetical protein